MPGQKKLLGILLCAAGLSGCVSHHPHGYPHYRAYTYEGQVIYPDNYGEYDMGEHRQSQTESSQKVVVPESYHVGSYHSPASHKDRDRSWVNQQHPGAYTIELADGDKASQVAGVLYKAPKKNRMAQVKYYRGGKTYYKGLYGSFPSYDAAQEALNTLPADIKQRANIRPWTSVQRNIQ